MPERDRDAASDAFVEIGAGALVGASAVVTKNAPPGATVTGVPASRARSDGG